MRWRGPWPAIGLACVLHAAAIARTQLPSHDGLKLLRTAAEFQQRAAVTVIRGSDRHPLYPMLVATIQPVVARFLPGYESWRISGQLVSALAGVVLLVPLFGLTHAIFGDRAAHWACLLWVILPMPAEVSREVLCDSLALCLFTASLYGFEKTLRAGHIGSAAAAGILGGLGYWARPEVALVAGVGIAAMAAVRPRGWRQISAALLPFALLVLGYTLAKGEISEKLALRRALGLPPSAIASASPARSETAPRGFTPKAELDADEVSPGLAPSMLAVGQTWLRALGVLLVPLALAGACLAPPSPGRTLLRWYVLAASLLLIRHVSTLHYISIRHVLTLAVTTLPWAAWRLVRLFDRLVAWVRWEGVAGRMLVAGFSIAIIAAGIVAQNKQVHESHRGHLIAGRWLAAQTQAADSVFDTHGWAAFVAGRFWHDPWHLAQALSDPHLRFAVVERREVEAATPRANALRDIMTSRARMVREVPQCPTDVSDAVRVYEFVPLALKEAAR